MSKKKRRDRRENSEKMVVLDLSTDSATEKASAIESAVNPETSKAGVFKYLKSHLWVVGVIAFLALGVLGAGRIIETRFIHQIFSN